MTMYASQKINNDQFPWKCREHNPPCDDTVASVVCPDYAPSTELDNTPNPLLLEFRDAMASGEYQTRHLSTYWVGLIATGYDWAGEWDHLEPHEAPTITADHIEHARKVLTRIATL